MAQDVATLTYLEGNFIKVVHDDKLVVRAHLVQGGKWEGIDRRPSATVERPEFESEQEAKSWVAGVYMRYCLAQILAV